MPAKTPTQRGISLLLNKAGFERSVSTKSRIRGMRNHSPGYIVASGYDEGTVGVRHVTFSLRPVGRDLETIAAMLNQYAATITEAGFTVERKSDHLVVTAADSPPET